MHNALLHPSAASSARSSPVVPHSHIKGLGLNAEGIAAPEGAGFIGQIQRTRSALASVSPRSFLDVDARAIAMWCHLDLIKSRKFSGRNFVLVGVIGTG